MKTNTIWLPWWGLLS